jgi:DNA invertase Pin-like site-specific DNA recombinase
MNTSDLIQARHRQRRAVVYVRQSSLQQVQSNQESLRLQYALKQRALDLEWPESAIQIIDRDLGHTAATTEGRVGFEELVAQIALGEVGILIAYDATRLARNCAHWYQLLDLCGRADCLIADRDGVYDPVSINGRLLLGLKGQISELELHTIRSRLTAGLLNKAKRGELAQQLPAGLVRLDNGLVVKHPDQAIQDRLHLVFNTLLEKKVLARVARHFRQHELKVPRQDPAGVVHWKRATVSNLWTIVGNPAYAGAFVHGRTCSVKSVQTGRSRQKRLPIEQWRYCVRDKYPAYISWETFVKIQVVLHDNYSAYDRNQTRGIARDGEALLHGIAYCGLCGHKLAVQYKGGTHYLCNALRRLHDEPVCQRLPGKPIDTQVVRWFFEALSAADIDVSAQTLVAAEQDRDRLLAARRQDIQRLRYQARLTERQYQLSDPENRLVTAELERRWEASLRELQEAEKHLADAEQNAPCWAIPADLLAALKDIGPRLPELWEQRLLSSAQKKTLLRALLDKVVLQRVGGKRGDHVHVRVVWRGGATTSADVPVRVGSFAQLSGAQEMQVVILRLAQEGYDDDAIAQELTRLGHRSPKREVVLPSTVRRIRLQHRLLQRSNQSHPRCVPGFLTVQQLASRLGVSRQWIHDRIRNGTIQVVKDAARKCYLFPDRIDLLRQFRQLIAGEISKLAC